MRIFGIMLAKNEGDFIHLSLSANRSSFDRILVLDNGSTDQTWDIVREFAARDPGVVAFERTDMPFRDSLRARAFNAFRNEAKAGDWWCRLDADEIYIDPVREFLEGVPTRHHVVWSISHQYYFTEEDALRWEGRPSQLALGSLEELPRHYLINHSEPRFFRHRKRLVWGEVSWPSHLGVVHPRRIRLQHYQYRSPAQIQRRLDTRREAAATGWAHFGHSLETDWREKITRSSDLLSAVPPEVPRQEPTGLPNHLERWPVRLVKHFLHGLRIWP